jgi:hypothetical protein
MPEGRAAARAKHLPGARTPGPTGAGWLARRLPPGRRWQWAALAAALAMVVTFDPRLYINGDNIDYILLGRAVRAGSLWPSEKYPPLLPYLLASVQALFGLRLIPQKLLTLAFGLGSIVLLRRIMRRRFSDVEGPILLAVSATLIPVVEFSHYTMSEIPYLFFLLGAVDTIDLWTASPPADAGAPGSRWSGLLRLLRGRTVWLLAVWMAAAFYTRSAGAALVGGLFLTLLQGRRWSAALALAIPLCLLGLPWLAHALASPGGSAYVQQFLLVNPYYPEFGKLGFSDLLRRLWENGGFYLFQEIPATVLPLLYSSTYSPPGGSYFPTWIAIPLLLPLLAGLVQGMRRRDPAASVLLLSLILSLVWPIVWAGSRFLVPAVPLLLLSWWEGWKLAERGGLAAVWRWARALLLVVLVLLGLRNLVFYKLETRAYPPAWDHYFAALQWIRANTPEDAVVIDRKPGFVEYVAGRKAVTFPREKDPERMLQAFRDRGATYVLLPALPYDDIQRYLQPALNQERNYFDVVARWPEPRTYVLRFYPQGKPGGGAASPITGADPGPSQPRP